jgi:predicted permease
MPQRTVWLRKDPVGSRPLLASRDALQARNARRSVRAGGIGLTALVVALVLRVVGRDDPSWSILYVAAIVFGAAGITAAVVALRARGPRGQAYAGLAVSLAAFLGALIAPAFIA